MYLRILLTHFSKKWLFSMVVKDELPKDGGERASFLRWSRLSKHSHTKVSSLKWTKRVSSLVSSRFLQMYMTPYRFLTKLSLPQRAKRGVSPAQTPHCSNGFRCIPFPPARRCCFCCVPFPVDHRFLPFLRRHSRTRDKRGRPHVRDCFDSSEG